MIEGFWDLYLDLFPSIPKIIKENDAIGVNEML